MDTEKNLVRYLVSICLGLCFGLLVICGVPVSYTHLDVYKRQVASRLIRKSVVP